MIIVLEPGSGHFWHVRPGPLVVPIAQVAHSRPVYSGRQPSVALSAPCPWHAPARMQGTNRSGSVVVVVLPGIRQKPSFATTSLHTASGLQYAPKGHGSHDHSSKFVDGLFKYSASGLQFLPMHSRAPMLGVLFPSEHAVHDDPLYSG